MLPFKLIYSDKYDLHLGDHVFPSSKYRLIHERLLESQLASVTDFLEPPPAEDTDVLLVHTADWVRKLKTGTLDLHDLHRMEIPYSPELVRAVWLCAGGSILAGRRALADGVAFNMGGGFHHAFPGHGEGFCVIHDVAIAIRKLQTEGSIQRALTVDLDVHHGNGTSFIFARDNSVFTFSMHQEHNYPLEKPPSDLDIHLPDSCEDEQYLHLLRENLHHALSVFHPDLIFYLAGADPYREDQLGGLALTKAGLQERDRIVFAMARERNVPVAVTFAGGYAHRLEDTIAIHVGTVRAAMEVVASMPAAKGNSA
ncbi:MAG: histone deacetylase [Acidobacteria bacterium RIFCSPLOWO2_02_FULL_61_28]|nr:MAG: histone deacetylase [Acidobacteria bacterium RIFCSPLOWO2_02_FULL_61_28]